MSTNDPTPPPSIDERLQAVIETLELVAAMQRENDKQLTTVTAAIQQDAENIRALARIAEIHERRLTDLEDSPPQ